jgi:nucleotide-binding universal stress UspA family protein
MTQTTTRKLIVGVDFGECGDDALTEAIRLFGAGWANELHPVHVLDTRDVIDDPQKPALATEEEVLSRAPIALRDRIAQIAAGLGVRIPESAIVPHARLGKAADALIQVAVDYDGDLIIVGTHGRRGLDRMLLGSVAEKLVRTATCPVFVARPKNHSKRSKSQRPDAPYKPGEEPQYALPSDHPDHISTESSTWSPSDNGPTGFRIV